MAETIKIGADTYAVDLTLIEEGEPYEIGRWEKRTVRGRAEQATRLRHTRGEPVSDWTRAAASALARKAMQAGLTTDQAEEAVEIGARFVAHGFTGHEIDQMIVRHYAEAARNERVGWA